MISEFDRLLTRYEAGEISRQEFLGGLTGVGWATSSAPVAEPAVGAVCALNHVTVFVQDVQKSVEFYQRLFGMPVLTRQEPGVNLRAGSGFYGIYPAQDRRPIGIHHVCFGLDRFDTNEVLDKLESCGVSGRVYLRGETKELYFTDPDGIRVQLQDVRYRGGVGALGDRDPE